MSGKNPLGNGKEPQAYEGINILVPVGGWRLVKSARAPTSNDKKYPVGAVWVNTAGNTVYILTSASGGSVTWTQFSNSGTLSSLTVVGTTSINASGSDSTTIGTGGTGTVSIGNTTGNTAVTGTLTASTGLIATAGGIQVSATSVAGASPVVNNVRTGQASFTDVIANGAYGTLTVTNSLVSASSVIIASASCTTANSAVSIVGIAPGSGSVAFRCYNAGSASTAANININFWVLN